MKKLALLLAFLFAFAASVYASDVQIAATTIPNFNPLGIGSDVALNNISVTNGSATVTSANQFRANWVGLGGFTITINGVNYTVAYVTSASNLTLTTTYAGSTSGAASVIWRKYIELRIYADSQFQPLGETYIVQTGVPGSGPWHKRIMASVINVAGVNTLFIPEIALEATTDSPTNNTARYSAGFYTTSGAEIQPYDCFRSFSLPPVTPTNWADICTYNNSPVIARNVGAYTQDQTNARFPSCAFGQLDYFATTGQTKRCLTIGAGLQITGDTLINTGGGGGSVTGSGTSGYFSLWTAGTALGNAPAFYDAGDQISVFANSLAAEKRFLLGTDQFVLNGDPARAVNVVQATFKAVAGQTGDFLRLNDSGDNQVFRFKVDGGLTITGGLDFNNTTDVLQVGAAGGSQGKLALTNSSNSHLTNIQAGSPSSALTFTLPSALPGSTQCLQISSAGVISATGSACGSGGGATPGGVAQSVQINNGAGAFDGDGAFLYDPPSATAILGAASLATGKLMFRNSTNSNTITFQPGATASNITFTWPTTTGLANQFLQTNGSGVLGFATALTSLNSQTGTSQTFATGTSGSDFNISSNTNVHTFNLPTASASNRGLLSSADWTTFNNKVGGPGGPAQPIQYNNGGGVIDGDNAYLYDQTTASVIIGVANSVTGKILLRNSGSSNTVTVQAGATSTSYSFTLPTAAPGSTLPLQMNSSGSLSTTNSPTFTDYSNAQHDHQDADDGGLLNASSVFNAGTVPLARGGTGASLSDPGVDRLLFWDDSAGAVNWVTIGANLSISGTTITAIASGNTGDVQFNNGSNVFTADTALNYDSASATLRLGQASTIAGKLTFRNASNANLTTLQPGTPSSSITFTLPATLPASAGCLEVNSSGVITQTGSACGSGGGSGYATIQEEGSSLTQRATLNFVGGGFTAADDAGNARTNVTLDATLNSLAAYNTNGILTQTAADTFTGRTITGTTNRIAVTNGDGVSGNPTLNVGSLVVQTDQANTWSTGAQDFGSATSLKVPTSGGAAPTADGLIAYDSTLDMVVAGQSGATIQLSLYDVAGSVLAEPGASQVVLRFIAPRAFTLPTGTISNGASANVKAGTAATAQADFSLAKNGSGFCTVRFAASNIQATYQSCTATDFAAGDVLTITAPASQDATLADVGFTIPGKLR